MKQARNIALTTVGTTGDVEPYVALAKVLLGRGHQVRVLSHPMHADRFLALGVDFRPVAARFDRAELNAHFDQILAGTQDPLRQFTRLVCDVFLHEAEAQAPAYLDALAGTELVVCHCFDYLGQTAAMRRGLPWASVFMMPDVVETAEAPPHPFPRLGRYFARAAWQAAATRAREANQAVVARLARAGIHEPRLGIAGALSPRLNLVAASPALVEARSDWPKNFVVTGAWWSEDPAAALEPELLRFLKEHPRPVVVTFGSMGGAKGAETGAIIRAALERAGTPAVVQLGYQGLEVQGERIYSAGFVPHAPLFATASLVVHHAGAGTAHAVARAGVPSVTVPHMFDQYYWAGMLARLGVAPKPLWRGRLDERKLADLIRRTRADSKRQARAQALGVVMQREHGAERAAELIESMSP